MASTLAGDTATSLGLGSAYDWMNTNPQSMPGYVSSASTQPAQADYYNYTPTTPMASISTPNYQYTAGEAPTYSGLMGGDYDALQQALYAPTQAAAQNAYSQGYNNLQNVMAGRGLYGSSMMSNTANQQLDRTYQQTLADAMAKATAQRYGMQAQDLQAQNAFNQNLWNQALNREGNVNQFAGNMVGLNMQQNQNQWTAQNAINQQLNAYNQQKQAYDLQQAQNMKNWQNQQAYEKYQYDLANANYNNANRTARINEALALSQAGRGSWQNQLSAAQMQNAMDQANQQGLLGSAGSILGALSGSGLLGKATDWIGGLLGGDEYTYGDLGSEAAWQDYWDNFEW